MPISVVTGASGGIGRWIALGLARAGHLVVVVARDQQRGAAAKDWIAARAAGSKTELEIADLSSLAATRQLGARIARRHPAIDVLVNNAGVFRTRREETEEGHEYVIAVNHLSPFVLTRALLPALRAAARNGAGARIVNIGSAASDRARIDPSDLEGKRHWSLTHTYGQSKLALTMATIGWSRRLRDEESGRVVANVVHPGVVATRIVRAGGPIGLVWRALGPFKLTEEQGADSPLHVALSPEFGKITGAYIKKRRVVTPNRLVLDAASMERVWLATETLAGV
jgi:NAD(P)-dependent dehydrogenase (short-subunit alcohol dehydrogenase family)